MLLSRLLFARCSGVDICAPGSLRQRIAVGTSLLVAALSPGTLAAQVTFAAVADSARAAPSADIRIAYGSGPQQFIELRRPAGPAPHPVALLLHGGCWRSQYDISHLAAAAEALRRAGIATWAVEYRRIGNEGGGDPGTFDDTRAAFDTLRAQGRQLGLDLSRIALVGHSAGGHLALWLAAEQGVTVKGVVALAAVTDLAAFETPAGCGAAVTPLLEASGRERAAALAARSPVARAAPAVPVTLVVARDDRTVPRSQADAYVSRFPAAKVLDVPGGHFDVVAPWTEAFAAVVQTLRAVLR
jgi:acetyl esterase/lipase